MASNKLNVFELAEKNTQNIEESYRRICEDNPEYIEILAHFVEASKGFTASINMYQDRILKFLIERGSHVSIWEEGLEDWRKDNRPKLNFTDYMDFRLGAHKEMRSLYNSLVENEELFKYAAVYASGVGVPNYGPFTVVIDPEGFKKFEKVVVLKEDSLNYVRGDLEFEKDRFFGDLGTSKMLGKLLTTKHLAEIVDTDFDRWDKFVTREPDSETGSRAVYTEVQILDEIKSEAVKFVLLKESFRIRMKRLKRQILFGVLERMVKRKKLSPFQQKLLKQRLHKYNEAIFALDKLNLFPDYRT